jgi:hypothetical protein
VLIRRSRGDQEGISWAAQALLCGRRRLDWFGRRRRRWPRLRRKGATIAERDDPEVERAHPNAPISAARMAIHHQRERSAALGRQQHGRQ